ncbi:hypothetical protein CVT24_001846, partial [Panaeolus cyanescens]
MSHDTRSAIFCHGCSTYFHPRGYAMHQALTKNTFCQQVHREEMLSASDEDDDPMDVSSQARDSSPNRSSSMEPANPDVIMADAVAHPEEDVMDMEPSTVHHNPNEEMAESIQDQPLPVEDENARSLPGQESNEEEADVAQMAPLWATGMYQNLPLS